MRFELEFNEALGKWRFRATAESPWSEYGRVGATMAKLAAEVAPFDETSPKRWSKPIDHAVRGSRGPTEDTPLYEIANGRVQRIAATRGERQKQQMEELAALIEGL